MPKSLKSTHGWHCQGVFFTSWGLWKSYKTPCTLSGLDPDQGASHEVDFRDTSVGDTNQTLVPLLSWRVTNSPILLINPCGVASIYIFLILFSTCFVTPGRIEPHDWEPFCINFGSLASAKNHSEIGGQKNISSSSTGIRAGKLPAVEKRWFPRGGARRVFDFSQANVDFEDPEGYYELEGWLGTVDGKGAVVGW